MNKLICFLCLSMMLLSGCSEVEDAIDDATEEDNTVVNEDNNTQPECDMPNATPVQLGVPITLTFAENLRFDCKVIRLQTTSGGSLSIVVEDEFSGFPNGTDTILNIFESSNDVISEDFASFDKYDTPTSPRIYNVINADEIYIQVLNDNGVEEEQFARITIN